MPKTRVLVADDHALLRAGLRLLIEAQADLEVVGEAADGDEAVRLARELRPDVLLLDLTMPGTSGMAVLEKLTGRPGAPRVVVVTMHDDPAYLDAAMGAGAHGYVVKRAADTELLAAIRAVSRGRIFVDAAMGGTLVSGDHARRRSARVPHRRPLSPRESEVLRLLAGGFTNREAAERLGVSTKTVETFRARVSEKLGLQGRAALVRYVVQTGMFTLDIPGQRPPPKRPGRG
jgi:two-component system response regulator NreC